MESGRSSYLWASKSNLGAPTHSVDLTKKTGRPFNQPIMISKKCYDLPTNIESCPGHGGGQWWMVGLGNTFIEGGGGEWDREVMARKLGEVIIFEM